MLRAPDYRLPWHWALRKIMWMKLVSFMNWLLKGTDTK